MKNALTVCIHWVAPASTVALLFATPAFADDQTSSGTKNTGVDEIVVTAGRREQSVLDVPLAIQATTGDQLQAAGIKQITDLQFTTPGYNVSDSNGYTMVFIRGVGNAEFVGADPSVTTFIDDVPRIYGSMVNNFVDVERVEVLKGAQGGLYGRNSTGGVINIITRQPDLNAPHADVRLSYASHNSIEADGYVTVPIISDKVALSVAGQRRYSDPYFQNTAPAAPYTAAMFTKGVFGTTPDQSAALFNSAQKNNDVGNQNFWAVDGKLLIKPSDSFKVTFAGDYSKKDDSQGNAQWQNSPAYEQQQFLGLFGFLVGELGGQANTAAFPANFLQGNPPKFTVSNGTPGFVRLKDWGVSSTAVLSTDSVDLSSITAYRAQNTQFIDDLGASSYAFTAALVKNDKHFFYQELRAVSHLDGPFQFIAGGTYLDNYFKGYTDVYLFGGVIPPSPTARSTDKVKNWSAYAQASFNFTDNLTLTASGRYVHEKNTAQFYGLAPNSFGPAAGPPVTAVEKKFIPSATLSYKLPDGGNVYVRWARGFKSGGVNPVANASAFVVDGVYYASSGSIFKGETVDTFEGGFKTQVLDHKVQLTADVFYNSYKNLQTAGHVRPEFANSIILTIVNAPSARTYGVEGSLSWRVMQSLTLSANAGYLNAKYKDFKLPDTPVLSGFDLSGHQMINSPEFQASFSANLDQPVTEGLNLVANALASHSSSVLWQVSGAPCAAGQVSGVTCLPDSVGNAYWLVNARIGFKTSDDRFRLEVFANNLFNQAYTTYGNSNAGNTTQFTWGNPRIVGVEATMHL
ncbi:TonB-dependent receptor [Novosphingobium sp. G106]|uniref:TonB-dependent receptor n=1 Tax=Novosphingobium sp. G106 TaxID=2849500 RepID=UPI001C2CD4B7|nr:TonB-dependent receptor [Novosphingobium sp. G106]MBV1689474.1 TonB-dependent receptor [Novosphingobium sp. G106]